MNKSEIDQILSSLWKCQLPIIGQCKSILEEGKEILKKEPNVLKLKSPITLVGDIHGQFYDMIELFAVAGKPPEQNFLFLGDYVDRGFYCVETFLLLMALKVRYPTKIYLLRGNHECRTVTEDYGFLEECNRKFEDTSVYNYYINAFDALPLAAVVDNSIFCVHGGLSEDMDTISDIDSIDRFQEPPDNGLFADLIWSDPEGEVDAYRPSPRGAGCIFGKGAVEEFLLRNNLKFMCRAHQVAQEGYVNWFDSKVFTVWSAPNYCYRSSNLASVMEIVNESNYRFKIFREAPASARGEIPEKRISQYFV